MGYLHKEMDITSMIRLTESEMDRCRWFTEEFYKAGKSRHKKVKRNQKEDCFRGKVAEIAFRTFMRENYGITISLDFKIHKHKTDSGDIIAIDGVKPDLIYDIKSVKSNAKWALVSEFGKDVYIFVMVNDNYACEVLGFINNDNLLDINGDPWFEYNNGKVFGKYLLNTLFVETCYFKALRRFGKITRRNQLYRFMKEVSKEIQPKTKIPLDAHNLSLPLPYLRRIDDIIPILKSDKIDMEVELKKL